jgi:tetratricopeptide (TPR) repeat protein
MNDDDKQRAQALVNRLLNEARENAAANEFRAALTAIKKAKALDQANVYLLALERQIEQIDDLLSAGNLNDTQKADILESVPRLVDQAIQSDSALGRPGSPRTPSKETPEDAEARIAAGRWLKNQYFQRAHDFVRKGEYDHALTELRRIFSVDDQDKIAREFELKILQMLELQRRQPLVTATRPTQPAEGEAAVAAPSAPDRGTHGTTRKSTLIWIAVIITLLVVAIGSWYFWKRHQATPAVPHIQEQTLEKTDEAPLYPVPPVQLAPDTTKKDSSVAR